MQVVAIKYNQDSNLLALHTVFSSGSEEIVIYTRSNWKWFSKQVIVLPSDSEQQSQKIAAFQWRGKHSLVVVGAKGQLHVIEYNFVYHSSMASCNHATDETGYAAVVDGFKLNLTPLGKMLMPPPMFEKQVSFATHPVCVSMFNAQVAVTDTLNNLYVFNAEEAPTGESPTLQQPLLKLDYALASI